MLMSTIIKTSAILGIVALSGVYFGKPAYESYQITKALTQPINFGETLLPKIDKLIADYDYFPTTEDIAKAGINSSKIPIVAYISSTGDTLNTEGQLKLVLINDGIDPELINQKVIFVKDTNGEWTCSMTVEEQYRPSNCSINPPPQPVYAG